MTVTCSVYGLGLSVNVPLAGLRGLAPARKVDVALHLGPLPRELDRCGDGDAPFYVSDEVDDSGTPVRIVRRIAGGFYRIDYSDGTAIAVDPEGTRIWARGATDDVEETAIYLLGPVLGFVLRLRGVNCLHASAVAIGDSACAFVGASGSGKSSLAAAFARAGYPVLSDDVTPVTPREGEYIVHPAYPRLRLWPDSVAGLFGDAESMPRIVPTWEKRFVDLSCAPFAFQREPLPLASVYLLDASMGAPAIEPVATRDALVRIVAETYATYLLDRERRASEFGFLASMVDRVPVRRLRRGSDLADAERACALVAADVVAARA